VRIAVLDLTHHPLPLLAGLPRASESIAAWLSPGLPEAEFVPHLVADGADPPSLDACDGLILSGSEKGVYDEAAWQAPVRALLLEARAKAVPVFGICFGHQLMADTYGGRAEKSAIGMVIGAREFETGQGTLSAHVWHQDQVTRVPPGATVTARAEYCPVGGLDYDFPAASVQYHPEYQRPGLTELLDRVTGPVVAPEAAEAAKASIRAAEVARDLAVDRAAALFRGIR